LSNNHVRGRRGCTIDIWCDAFIPTKRVDDITYSDVLPSHGKYHAWKGNDRGFKKNAKSNKIFSYFTLNLDSQTPLVKEKHDTGETIGYYYAYKKIGMKSYKKYETYDSAKVNFTEYELTAFKFSETIFVTIDAAAPNPLVALAPDIDFHYSMVLEKLPNNKIRYYVKGHHDGFPAYTIFIGDKMVYSFDPRDHGQTLWSLAGSGEWPVEESGSDVSCL